MTEVFQYTVDAISSGAIYALLALGLGLLFSVMGLVNLAYGELIMVGGFTMVALRSEPWPVLIIGTVIVVVAASLLTERLAFRPLRNAEPMTLLVASFTVSVMLQNGARMIEGPLAKGVRPYDFLEEDLMVFGVRIGVLDLAIIGVTIALMTGLVLLLRRTKLGIQLRAAAEDFEMANILGVRSNRVIVCAFAITGFLAAVASLMLIFQQGGVSVTVGSLPVLIAFVAIVVGGMGSLQGAALGGFLLGASTAVLDAALPEGLAPFRNAFLFAFVIAVLLIRPQGLIPATSERV